MTTTDKMLATREGAIGWITFNNPARRNAVSLAMWQALGEIVRGYTEDPSVRAIVLRGAGEEAFVSGADISEFEEKRSSAETTAAYNRAAEEATGRLERAGKPTLAMIRGYCIGGGVSIALCCDLRFAVRIVSGALAAIMSQYSRVVRSSSAIGTTRLTRPISFASAALNWRAVSMISSAYALPTRSTSDFIDEAR